MLYQNGKILYFNKTSYLKYLQCLLIVLKYDQKFNFVQEIKLQYIQKKQWQASTTTHDLFVNNLKISTAFICRGEVPSNTFAKLPVHVLINDPKKPDPKSSLQTQTHHLVMWPTSTSRSKRFCTFSKLPLSALINDPQKKCRASTRAHDPLFDILKIWPTFIYRGEVPSNTFAKLPVHVLINDPKKMFRKKLYVTIPRWFDTFPNMSDLWPGRNRAKCGLQLNDPIDWLKLRLSQPINSRNISPSTLKKIMGSIP